MNLKKLASKVVKAAKSPEGKAVIAVASVVLPIAAPKLASKVAKGAALVKAIRKPS
jgi:hypothetical protein